MNYLKEIKDIFIHLYYWLNSNTLIVQRSSKAIGDNLLLTIITSYLKNKYPTHKIIVETQFPEFFFHNPDVAFSTKHRWSKNKRTVRIKYHYDQSTNKSIYQQIVQDDLPGEFLVPRIYIKEEKIQKARELFPYPYICISPESKTDFAVNRRDWGFDKFQELVNLIPQYRFVQVGNSQTPLLHYVDDGRYIDLILTAAIIKNSLLYIGNEGGLMHLAKSVGKLSAIILSGYIKPEIIAYSDNLNIYEKDIPCSPCGHSDAPHNNCLNRICLDRISPLRVKEAIESFIDKYYAKAQ